MLLISHDVGYITRRFAHTSGMSEYVARSTYDVSGLHPESCLNGVTKTAFKICFVSKYLKRKYNFTEKFYKVRYMHFIIIMLCDYIIVYIWLSILIL